MNAVDESYSSMMNGIRGGLLFLVGRPRRGGFNARVYLPSPSTIFIVQLHCPKWNFKWPMSALYRVRRKKRGHRLMTIILSNLNRFKKNSLEDSLVNLQLNEYQNYLVKITLPCETLTSAKQAIYDKLQGSVPCTYISKV